MGTSRGGRQLASRRDMELLLREEFVPLLGEKGHRLVHEAT